MSLNKRIRCSDKDFMDAVLTSKSYSEISKKTGQKIGTTIARYNKMRSAYSKSGIKMPPIERKKQTRNIENAEKIVPIIKKLKQYLAD